MLKRKLTKVSATIKAMLKSGKNSKKLLLCKECDKIEVEVAQDIKAVTCAYCVQQQVAPPENIKPKEKSEFPRGWALKATYIHTDGRIFEKGQDTGRIYVPTDPTPVKEKKATKPKTKTKKVVKKKKEVVKKKTPKRRK